MLRTEQLYSKKNKRSLKSKNSMQSSFFTPQQIQCRKKQPYKLSLIQSYDFTLLNQDLFQLVSPHVQSISDQKRKIISWLKKSSLLQRTDILTYTNKQFVCLIRSMYEKKQASYYDESSPTFTISYIEQTDQFDLLAMINNKKLSREYYQAQDELLGNIRVMSRYTQFDSITFSESFIRNIDMIFQYFQVLGDGIAHQLTLKDYQRLKKLPNSVMFYDPSEEHCYKKTPIGTWITEVFMKHISMKYMQHDLKQVSPSVNELKQRTKQFEKYWKIITPQRKNEIIKKVLIMKPIDLYQEHRSMIKVTRNGFPPIEKSDKIPQLLKSILTSNQKDIFYVLFYTNLNQTLESHSILKYSITLELEDQIKRFIQLQNSIVKDNKMKKNKKKNKYNQKHHQENQKKQTLHHLEITDKQQKDHLYSHTKIKQTEKINTKGNDLFYKKLEVSQTHQIICFQSNLQKSQQSPIQNVTKNQQNFKQTKNKKKRKNKKKNKGSVQEVKQDKISESDPKLNEPFCTSQQQHEPTQDFHQQNDPQIQEKNLFTQTQKYQHIDKISQKSSETTNDYIEESKVESSDEQCNHQKEVKTLNPLGDLMKDLQRKICFYNKQRKIVLNRLSYVFAQHQLSFKLYGSSSCNLALPSSDIDIVVDPSIVNYFYFSYANYRTKIINSLEYLQKVFEKHQWAGDFTLLSGANIPLLTFTVNSGIEFQLQHGTLYNNKKQLKEEIKISVDVTIETYVNMTDQIPLHLGVESSELVKQWDNAYPFYSELLILIKIFTKNHNLNKIYHGGISSFMHAVILTTFFKRFLLTLCAQNVEFENKKQKFIELLPAGYHLTQIFLEYCKFIINFNQEKQIIDVNSNLTICPKIQNIPAQQLCIINPLTGNIMSQRCTTFQVYKKLIQQVYDVITTKKQIEVKQHIQIVFDQ